jgi:hypothetical protein
VNQYESIRMLVLVKQNSCTHLRILLVLVHYKRDTYMTLYEYIYEFIRRMNRNACTSHLVEFILPLYERMSIYVSICEFT